MTRSRLAPALPNHRAHPRPAAVTPAVRNYRGVDSPGEDQDSPEVDPQTVQRMVGRTESIARTALEGMHDRDRVTRAEFATLPARGSSDRE